MSVAAQGRDQIGGREGFGEICSGSGLASHLAAVRLILAGDEHYREVNATFHQMFVEFETGEPGELDVEDQKGRAAHRIGCEEVLGR